MGYPRLPFVRQALFHLVNHDQPGQGQIPEHLSGQWHLLHLLLLRDRRATIFY